MRNPESRCPDRAWLGGVNDGGLIGGFLIMLGTGFGRPQVDDLAGAFIDQDDILVGVRFLLAAVVRLLGVASCGRWRRRSVPSNAKSGVPSWANAWAATLLPSRSGVMPSPAQRRLRHRQQVVDPVVGLGLAQTKLQPVHGLQRVGFQVDHAEKQGLPLAPRPLCSHRQAARGVPCQPKSDDSDSDARKGGLIGCTIARTPRPDTRSRPRSHAVCLSAAG